MKDSQIQSSHAYLVCDSLIMCSDPEDLRRRASWDGASGTSRQTLLSELQRTFLRLISVMMSTNFGTRLYTLYDNDPFPATFSFIDTVEILSKRALPISQCADECYFFLAVL
jgi:hypothetical protein